MLDREHLERFMESLENIEADLDERDRANRDSARGTHAWVRGLSLGLFLLALANLYFVNDLTQELGDMIDSMREMTGHFDIVSERMHRMTGTVGAMSTRVAMMPVINIQMAEISGHVARMERDVATLQGATALIDTRIDSMNLSVLDMSQRFRAVNLSVGAMSTDVDQMARPVP